MRIAVYGTLRRGWGNNRLLADSKFVDAGKTKVKYTMYASGIPFVSSHKPTSNIHVEVFDVPEEDVPRVDGLEGHPNWYQRRPIQVILDSGEETTAELYFMDGERGLPVVESGNYEDA